VAAGSAAGAGGAAPDGRPAANTEDMILVAAGPFSMGADRGGQEDEHPAHEVTLAAFWLDKTEVTNEA
jgi:formylglycine-generating enzyme required for sulfatase activity